MATDKGKFEDTDHPRDIFKKYIGKISDPLGKEPNFTAATDFLFGEDLLTEAQLESVKSQPNLDSRRRGSAVAHSLYGNIKDCEKNEAARRLELICEIFRGKEVDCEKLAEIGTEMKDKIKGPTQVSPTQKTHPGTHEANGSENETIDKFTSVSGRLSSAIAASINGVVNKLHARGLITFDLKDELISGYDINSKKASKLVNELERTLRNEQNPDVFLHKLVVALKDMRERQITAIADSLISPVTVAQKSSGATPAKSQVYHGPTAYKVMIENTTSIKEAQIGLQYLADKMLEERIINESEKKDVMDNMNGLTESQRFDKLLSSLKTTIKTDGVVFEWFIGILKDYDTVLSNNLADSLVYEYRAKIV